LGLGHAVEDGRDGPSAQGGLGVGFEGSRVVHHARTLS